MIGAKEGGGEVHGNSRCLTLGAAMGVVLRVSQIDHKVEAYVAAMMARTSDDLRGRGRRRIIRNVRGMTAADRNAVVRGAVGRPDVDKELREIRRVRNNLAHNVDSVDADGVRGGYEPPVSYSRKKLEGVLDDASRFHAMLTRTLEKSPEYLMWVRAGISAKGG